MKILSTHQMTEVDRLTESEFGIPTLLLMENAGSSLHSTLESYLEDLESELIAIVCGTGNNGGDGIVLARHLTQLQIYPDVYLLGKVDEVSGDARTNLDAYLETGESVREITDLEQWEEISKQFEKYGVIVDALLGTGITKPLEGLYSEVVSTINLTPAFVLSVDIPSGMFSDSLSEGPQSVEASATVTFTAPKIAHILHQDQEAVGELHVVSIGSPEQLLDKEEHYLNLLTEEEISSYLPLWQARSHKSNFGHTVIVAGSRGKAGAAALSAGAAFRAGAGLVTICAPETIQGVVASFQPEVMTVGLPSTEQGTLAASAVDPLLKVLAGKDAAAMGPGLGRHPETVELVHSVVRQASVPLVLDADALNAFKSAVDKLENDHHQALIITPHPGEFSRLVGLPTSEILPRRVELARQMAQARGIWVVLKSFRTLIAQPDGQVFTTALGNPGMATAGMGDVLTGTIAALVGIYCAQGMSEPDQISQAVQVGVYLHSLAGDLAAQEVGLQALMAGDVTAHLGQAYQELDG
ncbi:MAG: NAD(P)H-hydrate dehydratase [Acidobacteriota bacterium]|nr:NAD(P)H-hydrate dehydratase [Acidobacteriota bacterium]